MGSHFQKLHFSPGYLSLTTFVAVSVTTIQIMKCTGRCVAVSEPNSPTVVAAKYRKLGDSAEVRQLARDVIRWECRPHWTMQPPPLGYFLKLRSTSAVALSMYMQVYPILGPSFIRQINAVFKFQSRLHSSIYTVSPIGPYFSFIVVEPVTKSCITETNR